jgi:YD repeat-containing protein
MKVTYDPEVDVLRILFNNEPIEESDTTKSGVILDYDKQGNVVGNRTPQRIQANGKSPLIGIRGR